MELINLQQLHDAVQAVCPIQGLSSTGDIWFNPTATQDQQTAAQALMTTFLADPTTWLANNKSAAQARAEGEAYVNLYFTDKEIQRLTLMLLLPTTAADTLAKIQAVLAWLTTIEKAWVTAPASFNATTFGAPPYTYLQIYS